MTWLFAYIIPLVAISVATLSTKNGTTVRNLFVVGFAYVPLALIVGLREGVGRDYYSYVNDFYAINELGLFYVEPGFWYLNRLVWLFDKAPSGVFLTSALTGLMLIAKRSLDEGVDQFRVFIAIFGVGYIIFSLSAVRQALSVAIFFFGIKYIWEGKKWRYAATILVGMLFHASIVFMAPFYYLLRRSYSLCFLSATVIGSVVAALRPTIFLSVVEVLPLDLLGYYAVYGERIFDVEAGARTGIGLFAYLSIVLIALVFDIASNKSQDARGRVLSNSVIFGFCGYIFFSGVSDLSRLFNYLTIVSLIWYPSLVGKINNQFTKRFIDTSLLTIFSGLYLYPIIFLPQILEPNLVHYR